MGMVRPRLVASAALLVTSCSSLPESLSPNVLVTQILTEETAIQQRCQQLTSPRPEAPPEAALQEQIELARDLSWQRFLKAVRVQPGSCSRIDDVKTAACSQTLTKRFASIMAQRGASSDKKFLLFAAGIATSAGYNSNVSPTITDPTTIKSLQAQLVVQDVVTALQKAPGAFVRALDLSEALVSRIVYLSAGLEVYANDLAKNVPIAPGAASVLLRELAGEAAAASTQYVVDGLETRHLVSKASVSASACRLYRSGSAYGTVTTKVLKRLILRKAVPRPHQVNDDGRVALCQVLNQGGEGKPCDALLSGAGIQRSDLVPTWNPTPPARVRSDENPVVKAFIAQAAAQAQPKWAESAKAERLAQQAKDLVGAADIACAPDERCDPSAVGAIASHANTVAPERKRAPQEAGPAAPPATTGPTTPPVQSPAVPSTATASADALSSEGRQLLEAIGGTRGELLAEVTKLQQQFGTGTDPSLAERLLAIERRLDLVQTKLEDAVNTIGFCSSRKEKLVRARYRLIDALTGSENVCEDSAVPPFAIGSGTIFMNKTRACDSDVYDSFEYSISEQTASCMQEASDAAIIQLQLFLREVVSQFKSRPKPAKLLSVEVFGAADQRAITSVTCDQKYPEGNLALADARAKWAAQRIEQGLPDEVRERVKIVPTAGPKAKDYCYQKTEACYERNRRTRFAVKFDSQLLERWCRQDSVAQPVRAQAR